MESLENGEDLLGVFLLEPDPRIAYRDEPSRTDEHRFDPDLEVAIVRSELEGVAKQVLKQLMQLRSITVDRRERADVYGCLCLRYCDFKV